MDPLTKFKISAYNMTDKVSDSFVIEDISARAAEKQAREILFKREGTWKITLVDSDPDNYN